MLGVNMELFIYSTTDCARSREYMEIVVGQHFLVVDMCIRQQLSFDMIGTTISGVVYE
jgi:hypothetical protein